jgi:hypothetical protein
MCVYVCECCDILVRDGGKRQEENERARKGRSYFSTMAFSTMASLFILSPLLSKSF